jgi:hypothetical protein
LWWGGSFSGADTFLMKTPTRRFILLGASNVTISFGTIVATVRRVWGEPVEIMAAIGHGRSYGQSSRVLGRKISGIFPCALWQDLEARPALPTTAVVTDVGNDILYGATPAQILEWVSGCLDRLVERGAMTAIVELPIGSLERLGAARFGIFRSIFFPDSRLTLASALAAARETNAGLAELGRTRKMPIIPVPAAWYGLDPIHVRRGARCEAWRTIMSACSGNGALAGTASASVWDRAYLHLLAPHERWIFGVRQRAAQPSGRLRDGTTISLY